MSDVIAFRTGAVDADMARLVKASSAAIAYEEQLHNARQSVWTAHEALHVALLKAADVQQCEATQSLLKDAGQLIKCIDERARLAVQLRESIGTELEKLRKRARE